MTQQAGIGLGICGDGKGWSGGATRSDGEASQPGRIKEKRPKVFLELEMHKKKLGRIVLELFGDVVPRTVENFRCLCTGERGISPYSGKPLHFKGSKFHRIIPGSVICGGDIVKGDGSGGDSIYNPDGDATFEDESFKMKHDRPGLISMGHRANEPGKNCSQFFIPSKPSPKLDGKHVVFGRVIQGLDVVSKLESSGTRSGKPLFETFVVDCGELDSASMALRKRKAEELDPLPKGWEKKESRSKPGLFYYQHESGYTQFERPSSTARDPMAAKAELEERRRVEQQKARRTEQQGAGVGIDAAGDEKVRAGEVRVWHIMKKHKDFRGKPASSWRMKSITWSQKEAKDVLVKMKQKLMCIDVGGGREALQRKFENYARLESDDDLSAKCGGDLGPLVLTKKIKLFGGHEIIDAARKLKQGEVSDIVSTDEGVHLVCRFDS